MSEKKYYGIYQGIVTNVQDTEKRGRIKIKCPDVLGGEVESAWCDPCVPCSFDDDFSGDFYIPYVDETVWVMFVGGDANRPVWLGSWWSKNKTPLKTDYKKLDDVRIISYKDFKITIHKDECTIENCGENSSSNIKNKIVIDKSGVHISTDKVVDIKAKGDIALISSSDISVKATGDIALGASNVNITASSNVNVKGATINLN